MADLRAEQILQRIESNLQTLALPNVEVVRDRVSPTVEVDSLSVEMGPDTPVAEQGNAFIDSILNVSIVAQVIKASGYSTRINQLRKEVHLAMMANRTLGFDYVFDVTATGTDKPEASGEGGEVVMQMAINFYIKYRHSITDASA